MRTTNLIERSFEEERRRTKVHRPEPDPAWMHRELKKGRNVTLRILWEEYKADHPDGLHYTQFCPFYRRWGKDLDMSTRQVHRAGEKMFVYSAGETVARWTSPPAR
uniref:hypothetical protein n=1 Tax=Limnochorda pilosa TaxID=1555112 RepID=UPI00130E17AA|nr:hypothetical protein [Limnochorda pilosa]